MKPARVLVEPFKFPLYIATTDQQWEDLELDKNQMEGAVLTHKGKMFVALPDDYEEYVVWHEAHHVARMLNGAHGVPTDADEHEADVYMQEHVVRLIKQVYAKRASKIVKYKTLY